ncbi:hypothetical protein [Micromonospora echinofusca]|uniref:hypothetical protein n=1 Tax=Micromonospora echinofusca TaxID=47858 RepID=UPI0033D6C614
MPIFYRPGRAESESSPARGVDGEVGAIAGAVGSEEVVFLDHPRPPELLGNGEGTVARTASDQTRPGRSKIWPLAANLDRARSREQVASTEVVYDLPVMGVLRR